MKKVNGMTTYEKNDACALDEYSEKLANDLQEKFNENAYDDSQLKQEIANIQQEQTTQNKNIKNNADNIEVLKQENAELQAEKAELELELKRQKEDIDNTVPVVSDCRENVTLNGTAEARFKKFGIIGNSWQKTRSGRNKIDLKNIKAQNNCTVNVDNEKLTVTLTDTNNPSISINCSLESGTYFVHLDKIIESINIAFYGEDGNKIISTNINNSSSFTLTKKAIEMKINSGLVEGDYVLPFKNLYINEGDKDLGYEEYGVMPSPEFPSEIQNCEGNLNFKICNKNFVSSKFSDWKSNSVDNYKLLPLKLKKGKTYKFWAELIGTKMKTINFGIAKSGNNYKEFASNTKFLITYLTGDIANLDINVDESYTEPKLVCYCANEEEFDNIFKNYNIQLEENTKTSYVEHAEQNFTFPLRQRFHKTDYLADDGIHHKRKQIILNGSENYDNQNGEYDTTDRIFFSLKTPLNADLANRKAICNYFVNSEKSVQSATVDITAFNFNSELKYSNYIYFKVDKSILSSPDKNGWKSWLADKYASGAPLIIEYDLAEEEIELYNEEQQAIYNEIKKTAKSYKETTHIFCTDEISCNFDVEALADMQSENDKLQAQIDEIKALLSTTATSAMLLDNMQTDLESEV